MRTWPRADGRSPEGDRSGRSLAAGAAFRPSDPEVPAKVHSPTVHRGIPAAHSQGSRCAASRAQWARCCAGSQGVRTWQPAAAAASRAKAAGRARKRDRRPSPSIRRVRPLEVENRRLQRKLAAETIITLQKSCRDPGDPPENPRHRRDRLMIAIEAVTTTGRTAALCQSVGLHARPSIGVGLPGRRRRATRGLVACAGARRTAGRPSICCTASDSSISRLPKSRPPCSRSRPIRAPRTMYRILEAAQEVQAAPGAVSGDANWSSWRRPRIRSGRGISPLEGADPASLFAKGDPRSLQPLRRG